MVPMRLGRSAYIFSRPFGSERQPLDEADAKKRKMEYEEKHFRLMLSDDNLVEVRGRGRG